MHDYIDKNAFGFIVKFSAALIFAFFSTTFAAKTAAVFFLSDTEVLPAPLIVVREEALPTTIQAVPKRSERSFAAGSLEDHVPSAGKFIGIDLVNMELRLYQNATLIGAHKILSKGKPGSHWETPSGSYEVKTKEKNHFSSIGRVNMPYSMQFFGNFFIHGWPTYESGKEVGDGYSGGCIRLSTDDAETVFSFADLGTSLYIFDREEQIISTLGLALSDSVELASEAYLVADIQSGEVVMESSAGAKMPVYAITKLMTAIVANESISFDKELALQDGEAFSETFGIFPERMVVGDLLHLLLLNREVDSASTLERFYGKNNFVDWMNDKARAIGMRTARFADTNGISKENVASADDLFELSRYLYVKKSFILGITRRPDKIIEVAERQFIVLNEHPFVGDESFRGGIATDAQEVGKQSMLTFFRVSVGAEKRLFVAILLGSENAALETRRAIEEVRLATASNTF
ncbi:MAG: hypothetical protein A2928_01350 [Candidatus Taylorbacteria bacterium RIFCSPLOWO2_01_FULL_45_15b]|uniref:L,D-TPase catalytic domain-containing protein n=1 Tax=Candidatus Taylorbacteria bacterium RIFCSPLOWO2_01_FULL_45_15b TaxID=1802319 RepID=A0A1G2N9Q5_9BACT|nr:MAG: hypothetical protein A2928_01350 [Candidatus Taylorbacteria bacterium RIFCSPLOWO2_01_FULL_45_15b]